MLNLLRFKAIEAAQQTRLSLNRRKILLIPVIIIVTALLLEGATRVFLGDKLPNELVVPTEIGQFDERLGWSKIPNSRATLYF